MHVHVVDSSEGPVDQWFFIDAIIDHDQDENDHNEGDIPPTTAGHCEHIYMVENEFSDAEGYLSRELHNICMDSCHNAGGVPTLQESGTHQWYECILEDCTGFEHTWSYENEDGTIETGGWCDYPCKASGGHLEDECYKLGTYCW